MEGGRLEGADKTDASNRKQLRERLKNLRDIIAVLDIDVEKQLGM